MLGALAAGACFTGVASLAIPPHVPQGYFLVQSQPGAQKPPSATQNGNHKPQKPGRRMGDWLQNHQDLPLDQQEKLLENDPSFKKLPADRQAALKERLRKFNALSPERRERALQRMRFMASLSQEQRKEIREVNKQLQSLPPDRRVIMHATIRHLRKMDPQQRQQLLESDRVRTNFSSQEQSILKQLASIEASAPHNNNTPPAAPQPTPK
ncbi:MAG: DUF3106 domain-containing protein [Candidatus Angelobacter sp.]